MRAGLSDGRLNLRLAPAADGTTRIVQREHRYPLHVTTALLPDASVPEMAFVYIQNPSGGIFAGDSLEIDIVVEAGARVHLTTTSATKAYAMAGGSARQRMRIAVGPRAYVEYVPQLLIPQRESTLEQTLEIVLEPDAICVAVEGVAPGRVAHGESFEYERLSLTTSIHSVDGEALAVDTVVVAPARHAPTSRGLLGGLPYFGTVVVATLDRGAEIADALGDALHDQSGVTAGAGALPHASGAMARVLAETSPALRQGLDVGWATARATVLRSALPRRPR